LEEIVWVFQTGRSCLAAAEEVNILHLVVFHFQGLYFLPALHFSLQDASLLIAITSNIFLTSDHRVLVSTFST